MREVRELAEGMREAVASIRKTHTDAKSGLEVEVARAAVNSEKVKAFTQELKDANLEVESFLGETGSNFPTSETSATPRPAGGPRTDINGVTPNQEVNR
jgi:hypothetical protein